jgi:1-phosphatidylinositol-4-phosphate 5-kinase
MENPNTLLTSFLGMHRVKPHKMKKMHFVIMGSVFYTDKFIHEVYDIKGEKCAD